MLTLGLETATPQGSLALVKGGQTLAEEAWPQDQSHTASLIPALARLLDGLGLAPRDLSLIAVDTGPGSFTGLRIGLAAAKGLGMALGLGVVGVSSLEALAAAYAGPAVHLAALLDARKNQVFAALFKREENGRLTALTQPLAISPARLARAIDRPFVFLGGGAAAYASQLEAALGQNFSLAPGAGAPRASQVARLGLAAWEAGQRPDPRFITPLYVRPSEAEIALGRRLS